MKLNIREYMYFSTFKFVKLSFGSSTTQNDRHHRIRKIIADEFRKKYLLIILDVLSLNVLTMKKGDIYYKTLNYYKLKYKIQNNK